MKFESTPHTDTVTSSRHAPVQRNKDSFNQFPSFFNAQDHTGGDFIQRKCLDKEIGEQTECNRVNTDVDGTRYFFKVNCDEYKDDSEQKLKDAAEGIPDEGTVAIHGFASEEGPPAFNANLACARAVKARDTIQAVLSKKGFEATILIFSHGASPGNRPRMRSVVVAHKGREVDTVPYVSCPPDPNLKVNSVGEYIQLIECVESTTHFSPLETLALLRQIYYGKPWSVTSQTDLWDAVIPFSVTPDPKKLHPDLFKALGNNVNVEGRDIGHVFTGLQAMMLPLNRVTLSALPPKDIATVDMDNEAFATWGGDLGATAAAMVACWSLESIHRLRSEDCGKMGMPMALQFYFTKVQAPDEDLEGDMDAYLIRANAKGIPCTNSAMNPLVLSGPVSQMFKNFYNSRARTGSSMRNRYHCFAEVLGAQISNRTITNKSKLIERYHPAVSDFAKTYFVKIMKEAKGPYPPHAIMPHGHQSIRLETHSAAAIEIFLNWLEQKL